MPPLPGPEQRPADDDTFLERLLALAGGCGITRLADITRLDTLGLPVWQAIRPAGRALSVHQGKGASPAAAKIGALCEAIESHCAETVEADGPLALFEALEPSQRAPSLADYSARRGARPPEEAIPWCRAEDLATGKAHYLPLDLVSLDFTIRTESYFDRCSTGLGAGPTMADALRTSLFELIERDCVGEWERSGMLERLASSLDPDSVPLDWFQEWIDRLAASGASLRVFAPAAVIGVPVFICWLEGGERFGMRFRRFGGSAAHGDPQVALFKAFAEAVQSRLTFIAAVRDDMLPSTYAASSPQLSARVPPVPPGFPERSWEEVAPHSCAVEALAEALEAAGYPRIAVKRLDREMEGVAVTKAFVPGLGSASRERRR
jgi:ribosomal protein S12 methylthiotransferase accessory factor